jgi:hypothetical protein
MPAERPPPLPAAPAVLRRASGPEAVLFSRRAGGWLGRPRKVFVLTAEAPAPLDTKRWVWISWALFRLFRSTQPRSRAASDGGSRQLACALAAWRLRARPQGSTAPGLGSLRTPRPRCFPCRRLRGSAASRSPRSSHCPGLGGSSARSKRARHSGTRSSGGDSARLAPRLASRSLAVVLASPPGTRAPRAAATAAHQEPSDGREYGRLQQPIFHRWYARGVARWWLWRVGAGRRAAGRAPPTYP